MNKEVEQILQVLMQGARPSVDDLEAKGHSPEAIKAVMARGDVKSVKAIHIGNGCEVTRLVLDEAASGQA